jgi:hypothetical protein
MNEATQNSDFDMQTAWLRRFKADAESNVKAFALRLKEALPEHVSVLESRPFLFGSPKTTGVSVAIGEHNYTLEVANGRLKATVAMIVRGITLSTKSIDPAEWFAQLAAETQKTTEHAKSLSQSLSAFMAS